MSVFANSVSVCSVSAVLKHFVSEDSHADLTQSVNSRCGKCSEFVNNCIVGQRFGGGYGAGAEGGGGGGGGNPLAT